MEQKEYAERLKFEHELINRRVTWLLTSQTILFAAYGVALDDKIAADAQLFLKTVAVTGAATAILVFFGILASFSAKYCTWRDFRNSGHTTEPFWVRTWITYTGSIPEFALPLVFTAAWAILL